MCSIIIIASQAESVIRQQAEQRYPQECVGLLLGHSSGAHVSIEYAYAAENAATDPQAQFLLLPSSYLQADQWARTHAVEIVGIYHSHPDQPAQPSASDLRGIHQSGTGYLYCIQSVFSGQASELSAWIVKDTQEIVSCEYVLKSKSGRD